MGRAKETMGSWNPGKGAWGKGGKGAYGLEHDWSVGCSGYAYGFEDVTLFPLAELQTPNPRKSFKHQPTRASPERVES